MYKLSINKDLFEKILLKKINILLKKNTNHWKKELLEPIIINNMLSYEIKQFKKIILTNGLGKEKPQITIECIKVDYSIEKGCFEFHLGRVLEQKNIIIEENDKDTLIKQLMEEREVLLKQLNERS